MIKSLGNNAVIRALLPAIGVMFMSAPSSSATIAKTHNCEMPSDVIDKLIIGRAQETLPEGILRWQNPEATGEFKILSSRDISGPCSHQTIAYLDDTLFFQRSLAVQIADDQPRGVGPTSKRDPRIEYSLDAMPPSRPGYKFVGASLINKRGGSQGQLEDYIATWSGPKGSIVGGFTIDNAGRVVGDFNIVHSRYKLSAPNYFPSADSPSGAFGLVADSGKSVKAIVIQWFHPDVFQKASAAHR